MRLGELGDWQCRHAGTFLESSAWDSTNGTGSRSCHCHLSGSHWNLLARKAQKRKWNILTSKATFLLHLSRILFVQSRFLNCVCAFAIFLTSVRVTTASGGTLSVPREPTGGCGQVSASWLAGCPAAPSEWG